ncbi:MAG: ABC transporter permease [Tissierellia bacterium]|nr:ABC transporter permease [Tissierellia bacterium]
MMNNVLWGIKNNILFQLRSPAFLIWCVIYPVILISIFNFAFSGLTVEEPISINIGYSENSGSYFLKQGIDFLHGRPMDLDEGKSLLKKGEIDGYIKTDGSILINEKGFNQTILKNMADIEAKWQYLFLQGEDLSKTDFDTEFVENVDQDIRPLDVIYFALLAMVSIYSYYGGVGFVETVLPNRSLHGQRIGVAPIRKFKSILFGIVVIMLINTLANIILILHMELVLKLGIIKNIPMTMMLIFAGNWLGATAGILVGAAFSFPSVVKEGIGIVFTLIMAALSGMMGGELKHIVDSKVPWINKINPVSIISNNLFRVNMLDIFSGYRIAAAWLFIIRLVMLVVVSIFLRRKSYDSI